MTRSKFELVEESRHGDQSAALFRRRVVNNTVYMLIFNGGPNHIVGGDTSYHYSTDEAFNALERWEVKVGKLPKDYNPEAI